MLGLSHVSLISSAACFLWDRYEWERQLPSDVRSQVVPTQHGATEDMSLLRMHGQFRGFPHFSTANPSLDKRCVNLLGQLSAWVLLQHADQLRAALGEDDTLL
jgi:hypothetical protein